jgi:hypothetical protein
VLLSQFGELWGLRQMAVSWAICRCVRMITSSGHGMKNTNSSCYIYHFMRYFEFAHKGKCKMKKSLKHIYNFVCKFHLRTAQQVFIKLNIAAVKVFRWILFYIMSVRMPPTLVKFLYYSKDILLFKKYIVQNLCTIKVHSIHLKEFWLWWMLKTLRSFYNGCVLVVFCLQDCYPEI